MNMPGYHENNPLRFACTGCGACCIGRKDDYVLVNRGEADAIQLFLGLSRDWFRRRYLTKLDHGEYGINLGPDGRCPFLNADDMCSIYTIRPRQCRSYPFWPEIVNNATSWSTEARRCEGIDRGHIVSRQKIHAMLALDDCLD